MDQQAAEKERILKVRPGQIVLAIGRDLKILIHYNSCLACVLGWCVGTQNIRIISILYDDHHNNYIIDTFSNNWTHNVCRWNNADQNHKASQMSCIASNVGLIDDFSLHSTVGPPSSPVGTSSEVEEGTTELLPSPRRNRKICSLLLHNMRR